MSILSAHGPRALRLALARWADAFAIGAAAALPWSATLLGIFTALWLIALLPTLRWKELRGVIATPAGGLPGVLFAVGLLGMAWSLESWPDRLGGFAPFVKFLCLPLLLVQFQRSDRGNAVIAGYLASCTTLLTASWLVMAWPEATFAATPEFGVPINTAPAQCAAFAICALGLLFVTVEAFRRGRRLLAAGALALAAAFLGDIVLVALPIFWLPFVLPLVVVPLLIPLLLVKKGAARAAIGLLAAAIAACAVLWVSVDPPAYKRWLGDRPLFWQRALTFIGDAPVIGHGSGAMPGLFARAAEGRQGQMTTTPFQQTLAVGVQAGLVGAAVLWAMWIAHLLLFRGATLPNWIGFVVVMQSIFGSMVESQLSGAWGGWTYVIGVGVAGGMARRLRAKGEPDSRVATGR